MMRFRILFVLLAASGCVTTHQHEQIVARLVALSKGEPGVDDFKTFGVKDPHWYWEQSDRDAFSAVVSDFGLRQGRMRQLKKQLEESTAITSAYSDQLEVSKRAAEVYRQQAEALRKAYADLNKNWETWLSELRSDDPQILQTALAHLWGGTLGEAQARLEKLAFAGMVLRAKEKEAEAQASSEISDDLRSRHEFPLAENQIRLAMGLRSDQVLTLLGTPDRVENTALCGAGTKASPKFRCVMWVWEDGPRRFVVTFQVISDILPLVVAWGSF